MEEVWTPESAIEYVPIRTEFLSDFGIGDLRRLSNKMNVLGLVISLANIQHFQSSGAPLKDISVKVAEVQNLYNELQAIPGLDMSQFRQTGYYRYKDVGKYLSKNLREYIFNGFGDPKDEGVILTLYYDEGSRGFVNEDDPLSRYLHKDSVGNEVKEQVQDYLDSRYSRNKRALDVLTSDFAN